MRCIEIESDRLENTQKEWVSVFNINHAKCIFCGLCVEVCPTGSLRHTKEYESSATEKRNLIQLFGKGEVPMKGGHFL